MEKEPVSETTGTAHAGHHNDSESIRVEVRRVTGINPARCYQCGKCTAGCPMAEEMGCGPHQILRLVQLDERDKVLSNEAIWLCLTCETCTARCPNEVDPARLIDGIREIAARECPEFAPRKIRAFHRTFLDQILAHGRIFEFGLVAKYKLRSGDLFADVASAPGMLARGKLKFAAQDIEGLDQIKRIFEACLTAQEDDE